MYTRKVITFIIFIISIVTLPLSAKQFTLVIDAGHGGHDAGAIGSFSQEKNINLHTALAFGRYVERNCPDVKVIYTRKTDVFVTLHGRADIANKNKADLFISIHTNSLPAGHTARGLETYALGMHRAGDNLDVAKRENSVILVEKDYKERYQGFDPNSSESYIIFEFMQDNNMKKSVELARLVQQNVCSVASRPDKGVKQAGFLVLRETSMPSCLIELGFISTPDEEKLLNDDSQIDIIARGIYQAFAAYKNKYDNGIKVPYKAAEPQTTIPTIIPQQDVTTTTGKDFTLSSKQTVGIEPSTKGDSYTSARTKVATSTKEDTEKSTNTESVTDAPVFKIQIFAADRVVKSSDYRLKGRTDAKYYREGGMVKYTIGESTNYNEIYQLRKSILDTFPDCFIIAFKNDDKMDVNEAIREYKRNKQSGRR